MRSILGSSMLLGVSTAAIVAACPVIALAQATAFHNPANPLSASPPSETVNSLEEVIVTAQKRAQSMQDVPVAVTALSNATLVANRITTVRDLSAVVPNLTVRNQPGGSGAPRYTIRGLDALGSATGADKGVALYINGVYVGAASGTIFELADIQRIEVLRGPQGTLFGRNSTGGAISIVTAEPTGAFSLRQTVTLGDYDQFKSMTRLNTRKLGAFSASVSYIHSERRGDVRNLGGGTRWDFTPATGGKPTILTSPNWLGGENIDAVSGAVKFQPNDELKLVYRFDYSENKSTGALGTAYVQPLIRNLIAAQPSTALIAPISLTRPDAVNDRGTVPSLIKAYGHSLTLDFKAAENVSLKNILAYRKHSFSGPFTEISSVGGLINTGGAAFAALLGPAVAAATVGAPFSILTTSSQGYDSQWSDELQLNAETKFVTLTTGALYYEQKANKGAWGDETGLGASKAGPFRVYPNFTIPYAGQLSGVGGRRTTIKVRSYAAYAYGEFHVMPGLDLVGGVRYTKDRKKGVDFNTYSAAQPVTFLVDYRGDKVTYTIGANYKLNSDVLIYGKYSTGYISGGSLAGLAYDPETAKSWEGGLKADWLNRRLRTNLALYSVTYDNLQFAVGGTSFTPPRPDINQALVNAGDARAEGFELEATLTPLRGLTLSSGLGYTDFKFLKLLPAVTNGNVEYLAPYRPKWTASLAVQYESEPLFDDVALSARLDGNWRSKQYGIGGVPASLSVTERAAYKAAATIPSYWIVNARVALQGFRLAGANASIALWAHNLLNEDSPAWVSSVVTAIEAEYERARTVGVDVTLEF